MTSRIGAVGAKPPISKPKSRVMFSYGGIGDERPETS